MKRSSRSEYSDQTIQILYFLQVNNQSDSLLFVFACSSACPSLCSSCPWLSLGLLRFCLLLAPAVLPHRRLEVGGWQAKRSESPGRELAFTLATFHLELHCVPIWQFHNNSRCLCVLSKIDPI